jgi:hypothetical protein
MNGKIRKSAIAAVLAIVAIVAVGQPAHAQGFSLNTRADRASYVPGDSGTLTITLINTGTQVIQLNNLTVYFPWAGFGPDGKWQGNSSATYSNQFLAAPGGTSSTTFTTSFQFTIPTWYGQNFPNTICNGSGTVRYGQFSNCIVVGSNAGNRYDLTPFTGQITMAIATYTPISLVSQAIPIATLVVLVIATAFLALAWTSTRRSPSK